MARSFQIERFEQRMAAIPVAVRTAVLPALDTSATELASMMKSLAPVDEGDLKDSIVVTLPGRSTPAYSQPGGSRVAGELEALVTVGDHEVRYAHLQEYGTVNNEPHPFFWPSVRLLQKRIKNRIKRAVAKAVRGSLS